MKRISLFLILLFFVSIEAVACSIVYFIDSNTGKIYVANNEDYWYATKDYIQLMPAKKGQHARLWYGWKDFAQGGINSKGLFFDAAVTPKQNTPEGYSNPNGRNLGDTMLAHCTTVDEAIVYLEKEKIALSDAHILFGDAKGNAAILEWINGEKHIIRIENNVLIATNYLLKDTSAGNFPCYRYQSIDQKVKELVASEATIDLRRFGQVIAGAVQPPREDENGKVGGTLYTSVINITDMEFVLVPKLDNTRAMKLDLKEEFLKSKKRKIKLSN